MPPDMWVYGAVLLLAVVHLLAILYTYRRGATTAETEVAAAGADRRSTESPPEEETVVCPNCGAENESGYRFCRRCVASLTGGGNRTPAHRAA